QTLAAAPFHFDEFRVERFKYFARSFVNIIGPSEVTTVMVSNAFTFKNPSILKLDSALINELLQKDAMMDHVIITPKISVFVFNNIKTMRAGSNNLFNSIVI